MCVFMFDCECVQYKFQIMAYIFDGDKETKKEQKEKIYKN